MSNAISISLQREPMSDGAYWSPDCGSFMVKDGLMYLDNGDIWDSRTAIVRVAGWRDHKCAEDFSSWDDDRRCLELAIHQASVEFWEEKREADRLQRLGLIRSARAKLTAEEFNAVFTDECGEFRDEDLGVAR